MFEQQTSTESLLTSLADIDLLVNGTTTQPAVASVADYIAQHRKCQ